MRQLAGISELGPRTDLLILGAGPAGMGAAIAAAELGLRTLVVDENPAPGGQIYRAVSSGPQGSDRVLGRDYRRGATLEAEFQNAAVDYLPGTTMWSLIREDARFAIGLSRDGQAGIVGARHVILASGAMERPFCVPGWTLPGVMTAGAAQIALKTSGLVPGGRVVLAGSGPLLFLLAAQLRRAGAEIAAFLDTTPRANWRKAAPLLPGFLRSPYARKGLALLAGARIGGRMIRRVTGLRIEGDGRAERVVVSQGGRTREIACDHVLLHQGVIPSIALPNAVGCNLRFDHEQHCWVPERDEWFASSIPGIAIAGDAAGIGGAESAPIRGRIAAIAAAQSLGRLDAAKAAEAATAPRRALARSMRGRRFLDVLYRPSHAFLAPPEDAIACRCEEITAGQIRATASLLGVQGPNQMKAFLRCGMGPCQGRLCAPTVCELIAEARGVPVDAVGTYRLRPPFKPVTVGELASLPKSEAAIRAVVR